MTDAADLFAFVVTLLLVAFLGIVGGCAIGIADQKAESVDAGHAEFYIGKDHERQWRWKTNCTQGAK